MVELWKIHLRVLVPAELSSKQELASLLVGVLLLVPLLLQANTSVKAWLGRMQRRQLVTSGKPPCYTA
jgi:hypothetical protein